MIAALALYPALALQLAAHAARAALTAITTPEEGRHAENPARLHGRTR